MDCIAELLGSRTRHGHLVSVLVHRRCNRTPPRLAADGFYEKATGGKFDWRGFQPVGGSGQPRVADRDDLHRRGDRRGLGFMIQSAAQFLNTDIVVLGIGVIALVAFAMEAGLRALQRRWVPWQGRA
jgi:hypothetical protein